MTDAAELVHIWRGDMIESVHHGYAVITDESGQIVDAWGDPDKVIYPRSSCKMIQALPLVESGAAAAFGLGSEQLALACASHQGAAIHTKGVAAWLEEAGIPQDAFLCGPQMPNDKEARYEIIRAHSTPCRIHNNCSGKHAGFLTLNKHLKADANYVDPSHPIQRECLAAIEELTESTSPGYGIDGCSAPNFATTMKGFAHAMAKFAAAGGKSDARSQAMVALREAMMAHPELVAGSTRACTELMEAMNGRAAIKTGAEGVFAAILPEKKLGVAVKIADGTTRASECVMAAILVQLGVLDPAHPAAQKRLSSPITNWDGLHVGRIAWAGGR